jgi:hypothetical protein
VQTTDSETRLIDTGVQGEKAFDLAKPFREVLDAQQTNRPRPAKQIETPKAEVPQKDAKTGEVKQIGSEKAKPGLLFGASKTESGAGFSFKGALKEAEDKPQLSFGFAKLSTDDGSAKAAAGTAKTGEGEAKPAPQWSFGKLSVGADAKPAEPAPAVEAAKTDGGETKPAAEESPAQAPADVSEKPAEQPSETAKAADAETKPPLQWKVPAFTASDAETKPAVQWKVPAFTPSGNGKPGEPSPAAETAKTGDGAAKPALQFVPPKSAPDASGKPAIPIFDFRAGLQKSDGQQPKFNFNFPTAGTNTQPKGPISFGLGFAKSGDAGFVLPKPPAKPT